MRMNCQMMYHLDQGQEYLPEKQSALEDRYYNNQGFQVGFVFIQMKVFHIQFQDDFPVNDPEIQHAATKIQAKFRGHKARQNVEKLKQEVCLKKQLKFK